MDFNIAWYILLGVLLTGYAILDGFDLGVGALHLFSKGDLNRRMMLNAIGPVWDGNEVWLVTAGGALFAAFPDVYATAFSGFYLAFIFLLFALIFRAVSIEFRSKEESKRWRNFWDGSFSIGSILAAILFGVAIGNVIVGFEIGADKEFYGGFWALVTPYTVLTGVFNLVMFTMHGAIYLSIKTRDQLQEQAFGWAKKAYLGFVTLYAVTTAATLYIRPEMLANFSFGMMKPSWEVHSIIANNAVIVSVIGWLIVLLNALAIANIPRMLYKRNAMGAFISSACVMAAVILFFALGLFPNLMVSTLSPEYSLNIYNSSASPYTLQTMFIIALIGMPFVIAYTSLIYWTYRGPVKIEKHSY